MDADADMDADTDWRGDGYGDYRGYWDGRGYGNYYGNTYSYDGGPYGRPYGYGAPQQQMFMQQGPDQAAYQQQMQERYHLVMPGKRVLLTMDRKPGGHGWWSEAMITWTR